MIQNVTNYLTCEVEGIDLTTAINIEFYVRQGHRFFKYTPEVLAKDTMAVVIPMRHARSLQVGAVDLEFALTDENGRAIPSDIVTVEVERFLKEAGYEPIV